MNQQLYTEITACRACGSEALAEIKSFPEALPSGLYTDKPNPIRLPLSLLQCSSCGHAQLREVLSESIYEQYIYVTPPDSTLSDYLDGLARDLQERFSLSDKRILEVGSSNGAFLSLFAASNEVLGLEPSHKLAETAREQYKVPTLQGYLGATGLDGTFDLVLCRHVLEHINDLNGFASALQHVCHPGSLLLVEVPSFDRTIESKLYSNVFHEHVNYFTRSRLLGFMAGYGFAVVHEYANDIHGGSMGMVFAYSGESIPPTADIVPDARTLFEGFENWRQNILSRIHQERLIGYGAAHRTFTLLSILGLVDRIDHIVDKNPGYQGKYIGGTAIPILSAESLRGERGRQILLFASSYEREILRECSDVLRHNTFVCTGSRPRTVTHTDATAAAIRRHILGMKHRSGSSHSGSALSITDILTVLYFRVLQIDPEQPDKPDRDRFILSKGHASAALYATLALRGFMPETRLEGFFRNGGSLPGHVDMTAAPGIEASSGSLGHGLSIGAGMAIALRKDAPDRRVFVLCGDGEMDEGSVWEAVMFAARQGLDNLVLVVDNNRLQGYATEGSANLPPLAERLAAFGWATLDVDGHDHEALEQAFRQRPRRPLAVVANTIKGKGVSFMEDQFVWHYRSPNAEQLAAAIGELE